MAIFASHKLDSRLLAHDRRYKRVPRVWRRCSEGYWRRRITGFTYDFLGMGGFLGGRHKNSSVFGKKPAASRPIPVGTRLKRQPTAMPTASEHGMIHRNFKPNTSLNAIAAPMASAEAAPTMAPTCRPHGTHSAKKNRTNSGATKDRSSPRCATWSGPAC